MSVKCLLCGGSFDLISSSHLKYRHGITYNDYREMFPHAELGQSGVRQHTLETIREMSESHMGHAHSEETKRKISVGNTDKVVSAESRQLMSESHLGHVASEETKQKMQEAAMGNQRALGNTFTHTEEAKCAISIEKTGKRYALGCIRSMETRQKMREAGLGNQNAIGYVHTEEEIRKMREAMLDNWKDPEYARRMSESWGRKPNERELQLLSVLDKHFPGEWKFVGDGTFRLEGKNPDFMNVNGKKQLIEIFGYYWHDPTVFPSRMSEEELIAHYRKFGFDCIVFWEFDVYNEDEVVERVKTTFGKER